MANHGDRFRRRALSRGYKVDEVDAFLDRVEATLAGEPMGAPVPSQEVDDVVFRVRFGGYDEWQVDVYLDRVARQLSELEERGVLGRAPSPEFMNGPRGGEDPGRDEMPPRDIPSHEMPPSHDMPPREMSPARDRHAMHAEPSTPPPMTRREPARGGRSPIADDGEGFGHLRADDGEGFGHLAGGPDDDDPFGGRPTRRHSTPPGGFDRHDDRFDGPPGDRFDGPPMGGPPGRFDGPPDRFEQAAHAGGPPDRFDGPPGDRFDGPPMGGPPGRFDGPPDRFEQAAHAGGPTGPGGFDGPGGPPQDRFAPPQERRFMPEPESFASSGPSGGGSGWGAEAGPFDRHERPMPPAGPPSGYDEDITRPMRRLEEPSDADSQATQRLRRGGDGFGPPAQRDPMPHHGSDPTPPRGMPTDPTAMIPHPATPQPSRPPSPYGDAPGGYRDAAPAPSQVEHGGAKVDYGRRNPYEGRGMFDGPGRHGREEMTTELRSADSPFKPEDLQRLEQLRGAFQPRRFGSGYDPAQVDRIFDAMSSNMTGRSPVPVSDKELDTSQFSLVQRGYFEAEVDAALREIRDIFAKRGMVRLSDE